MTDNTDMSSQSGSTDGGRKENPPNPFEATETSFFGKGGTLAACFSLIRSTVRNISDEWANEKEYARKEGLYRDAYVSLVEDGISTENDDVIEERINRLLETRGQEQEFDARDIIDHVNSLYGVFKADFDARIAKAVEAHSKSTLGL